jgi:hypothetical protein
MMEFTHSSHVNTNETIQKFQSNKYEFKHKYRKEPAVFRFKLKNGFEIIKLRLYIETVIQNIDQNSFESN